ncbi:TetR/AcrR family transcriptional regulator [Nonomuraea montanisoli]|nr:TetR family transcriptional regulator [Nonomuraea montanisoli]
MTGRRNPGERRRRMIEAACELIPEVGVNGLTHRLVAARAGVPLGATTYYFASLDDLVAAALARAAEVTEEGLGLWSEELERCADVPATLAALTADYLRERDRMVTWNELYAAAAHRPELRPLARLWLDGLTRSLSGYAGARAARAAAVFVDGALLYSLINDEPLDTESLERSLAALLGMDAA